MLELPIVYLSPVEIDLDVERIVDKDLIILFIINFYQSISKDKVWLLNILKSIFKFTPSQRYLTQQQKTLSSLWMKMH